MIGSTGKFASLIKNLPVKERKNPKLSRGQPAHVAAVGGHLKLQSPQIHSLYSCCSASVEDCMAMLEGMRGVLWLSLDCRHGQCMDSAWTVSFHVVNLLMWQLWGAI